MISVVLGEEEEESGIILNSKHFVENWNVTNEHCVFMERNLSIGVHGPPTPRSSPLGFCNVNNLAGNLFPTRSAHIPPTTDESFRFHNRKIDEMNCKLDSTENLRSFEKYPTPPYSDVISIWRLYLPGVEPGISRWLVGISTARP